MEVNGYKIEPKANLVGANLEEMILIRANLSEANFSQANLSGVILAYANLECANLTESNFEGANLIGTVLTQVSQGNNMYLYPQRKDPKDPVDINDIAFSGMGGQNPVDFYNPNPALTNFVEANLAETDLTFANLYGSNLSKAKLTEANLKDADLSFANLTEANLRGANFTGASFFKATLIGADFEGADLRGADFTGTDLRGANLKEVVWDESTIGHNAKRLHFEGFRKNFPFELVNPPASKQTLTEVLTKERSSKKDFIIWDDSTIWPEGFPTPPSGQ